ncbi:MAG TPA: cyclic nucleotide-binding domain-containing protein [Chloroflexota bacterium]|jgi:CRP-like cAMP-binding protein|nr:cyclic nucleotide-binding domain-containing protein [Chloroflexota bacterium]
MTEQQLMNELTQTRLLSALTYPALRRVVQSGRLIQARQGQVVLGPGFGTTGFFVVLEGSVAVSLPFGPVLAYLEQGEAFGETALLEGVERTAYCRAYSDCLLFEVPFDSFHADLVASDVTRKGLDELSASRSYERKAIREGAEPPNLTPPDPPQASEASDEEPVAAA